MGSKFPHIILMYMFSRATSKSDPGDEDALFMNKSEAMLTARPILRETRDVDQNAVEATLGLPGLMR